MSYEIKRMSIGEILDTSLKVFLDNLAPLFGVAFVFQGLIVAAKYLALGTLGSEDEELAKALSSLAVFGFSFLLAPFNVAITTRIIADRYLGRAGDVGTAVRGSLALFFPLLTAVILGVSVTLLGFILILPGFYFLLRFKLIAAVTVVEKRGGMYALGRSGMLVKGAYGKILVLLLISVIASIFTIGPIVLFFGESLTTDALSVLIGALVGSYFTVVWTVAYFERRCEHENFDMQLLAQSFSNEE